MAPRNDAATFLNKAREFGLIDEMDREIEIRKNEDRLSVIAEIAALPAIEETDIPSLTVACAAAHIALEKAQEAYALADRKYKSLSIQGYGAQSEFDGNRFKLEQKAYGLSPDFLRNAFEDLGLLSDHVKRQFQFKVQQVGSSFFGGRRNETTSNGSVIAACEEIIKAGRARIQQMMLEPTAFEDALGEAEKILSNAEKKPLRLGSTGLNSLIGASRSTSRKKPKTTQTGRL